MPFNESNNLVIYSLQACAIVEKISNSNVIYKTPKTLNSKYQKKKTTPVYF